MKKITLLIFMQLFAVSTLHANELIVNGNFESSSSWDTGWKIVEFTSGSKIEEIKEQDNTYIRLHHNTGNDWCGIGQEIASKLETGAKYIFSYKYKTSDAVAICIFFSDINLIMHGSIMNSEYGRNHTLIDDNIWHTDSFEFTVTEDKPKSNEPMLGIIFDYKYSGDIYVDDISVKKDEENIFTDQVYYQQYNPEFNINTIARIDIDGSNEIDFFKNDFNYNRMHPAVSGDGKKIAFIRCNLDRTLYFICVSDVNSINDTAIFQTENSIGSVNWHPNNNQLVFVQTNNEATTSDERNGDVYTININGSQLTNITNTWDFDKHYAAFSPNGKKICFSQNETTWYAWPQNLFIIQSDGTGTTKISNHETGDVNKVWSCCFINDYSIIYDKSSIWRVDIDGSNNYQLTDFPEGSTHPNVNKDGSKIVFTLIHEGFRQIATSNIDGSNVKIVTSSLSSKAKPFWTIGCISQNVGNIIGKLVSSSEIIGYTANVQYATVKTIPYNLTSITDSYGRFQLNSIPVGEVVLQIESSYFQPITKSIQVREGENNIGTIEIFEPKCTNFKDSDNDGVIDLFDMEANTPANSAVYADGRKAMNLYNEISTLKQTIAEMYTDEQVQGRIQAIIDCCDTDGNGKLSISEIINGLEKLAGMNN